MATPTLLLLFIKETAAVDVAEGETELGAEGRVEDKVERRVDHH